MALKSAQSEPEKAEVIEENLGIVESALDRVKVLYEQYFLGIQKQPPTQLHAECERRLRELSQLQIRNTALRYRFATVQQKFGSYNTYWRRTLRQIEQGKYHRNLSKIGRQAAQTGEAIPEEILAAMPKRMREQVMRDREAALAIAKRRHQVGEDAELALDDGDILEEDDAPAMIRESTELRPTVRSVRGPHVIDESDGDLDLDAFFAAVTNDAGPEIEMPAPRAAAVAVPAAQRATQAMPVARATPVAVPPSQRETQAMPTFSALQRAIATAAAPAADEPATSEIPVLAGPAGMTGAIPRIPLDATVPPSPPGRASSFARTGLMPKLGQTGAIPRLTPLGPRAPGAPPNASFAPSQATRQLPIIPGAYGARTVPVESMNGPFPRAPVAAAPPPAPPRAAPPTPARVGPPPGMTDADVNALYATYVKAKMMVGEEAGPGAYSKLLKTINAQAPKIMEQYKAKGVDFSVVVKDNQVVIRAKPKP